MEKETKPREALFKMGNLYCALCPYKDVADCRKVCDFNKEWNKVFRSLQVQKKALTEKQDLERFTKLVCERKVDVFHLSFSDSADDYNKIWDISKYCLTEEEFNFIKEMIKKYGQQNI